MHTMWKGSLSFGLVNVPVRMFAATESKDVKLRYLHKECKTPIKYTRTCPTCDKEVNWEDIVRGYEYEPDHFVILDEDELKSVQKERSHTIDIVSFVQLSDIDPVYYDKTYYLAPESSGTKAYQLLKSAMDKTGKIAIAKTVLRNSETLCCVRIRDDVVVVETLFWPAEVRTTEELPNLREHTSLSDSELNMAVTLIEQLATSFQPDEYVDERKDQLEQLIRSKIEDEEVAVPAAEPQARKNIVDLMDALQESIKMTQADKTTAGNQKTTPSTRKKKTTGTGTRKRTKASTKKTS
ncbi:Ku protein [Alicyclobacillus sp. SO9]|uniref:non-homologous end joining protein Ku n=1 Tax=Alicyclobacillus sp. SO9 TaxID=2665646 RepID=UPI0018E7A130|nr:Ku protein [Alicyclobacillus sp. SO9]QQE76778.1 Ku protein [Alicyclobacillus sp. SO9]